LTCIKPPGSPAWHTGRDGRRRRFETLAHEDPALGDEVMTSMLRSLERAHDHMMLLGRKTAQEKIATFLLDIAKRMPGGYRVTKESAVSP
jgi:CRP/FNR family nitrogen fixation transcriptional regulator